jgi:hypothetical protein
MTRGTSARNKAAIRDAGTSARNRAAITGAGDVGEEQHGDWA